MGANADCVRKLYDAFGQGDVPTVLGAMDDKIDWQEPAGLPYENQVGPQAVAENIFGAVTTDFENFSVTPHEIVDGGNIVAAIGVDGKVSGFRTYTDTHLWRQALGAD